ncbi:uncharacterized protein PRCAT00000007001 [Priceomyces carsonii]|uniref:uncharacterized protein n=1 Tax=Priceomyces carsonii TaxID=28549 RepID=UPI002EDB0BBF|nr:unnamed protein product [Priceomyces carsonii]
MKLFKHILALAVATVCVSTNTFDTAHKSSKLVEREEEYDNTFLNLVSQTFNRSVDEMSELEKELWEKLYSRGLNVTSDSNVYLNFSNLDLDYKAPHPQFNRTKSIWDKVVLDSKFLNHKVRYKKQDPSVLGVDDVLQYTGYLDTDDDKKHFFFWFLESRNDPKNDPLILWLSGGPGCSSIRNLFFLNGPSKVKSNLTLERNPYSWNNNASIIYLDQPVNTGFSYSDIDVTTTVAAGEDLYAFLELFFKLFPEYKDLKFHITGESYAGHYIPQDTYEILQHEDRSFNVSSIIIGNGWTDPLIQYKAFEPMACGQGGYEAVLNPFECASMSLAFPLCEELVQKCYDDMDNDLKCFLASLFCDITQYFYLEVKGENLYDLSSPCNGSECYMEYEYIERYFGTSKVREALGIEVPIYYDCSPQVLTQVYLTGDNAKPFQQTVPPILDAGIPILLYSGDRDWICNWLGNDWWSRNLEWSGKQEFNDAETQSWYVDGEAAGTVRNYKHFTSLRFFNAGHQVPYNQPKNALDMLNKFINGNFDLQ